MNPGTRVCVGRETVKGTVIRARGPIARVKLDGKQKPVFLLLSSLKEVPTAEIIEFSHHTSCNSN